MTTRTLKSLEAVVCILGLAACDQMRIGATGSESTLAPADSDRYGERVEARLIDGAGERVGRVVAWQGADGVLIQVRAERLPHGMHGLHLHAVGDCSDIGAFKASGGHIGGSIGVHGYLHPEAAHDGDLPNLYAHESGTVRADFFATRIAFDNLRDEDGSALIIHAQPDDYQTQPIGGAGTRIACAAFAPPRSASRQHWHP